MGDDRWYETDFDLSPNLEKAAEEAIDARENGAKTYNTKVGAAVEMYDGEVYTGFNMENLRHNGIHAEETAITNALSDGYSATDFRSLMVVFVGDEDDKITVPCLQCQAMAVDYTHPRLNILEVGTDGEPLYQTRLDELIDPPGDDDIAAYPSVDMMGGLSNREPKLPLADELVEAYEEDEQFRTFCDQLDIEPS